VATVDQQVKRPAREVRAKAESGRGWYAALARIGLVAKGISYGLVGVLAIGVAVGHGGKTTSRQGALATLADESWGKVVLVLLAAGFAAYAAWRFVQAFAERRDADDGEVEGNAKKWGKRAGYVARGLIYGALAFSAVKLLFGANQQQSQTGKAQQTTSTILSWPAGRTLVAAAGIGLAAYGVWNLYRGIARTFEDRWRTGEMSPAARRWGGRVGLVGHCARFVVFALIGVFFVKAAVEYDPKEAIGLDGALQKLAHASYGPWLLGVTAAGLVAYGVYSLVDARFRDVSANR
jgi:hypothetical protein